MAQAARLNLRMQKELKLLLTDPPPGATFPSLSPEAAAAASSSSSSLSLHSIDARPEETVYAKGLFKLKIQVPERYPFQPPVVTFATPIYHPNIDNGGRICLDILNLPPKGAWQPSLNISTVITSIGLLLSEPNPDDGLMHEASREYKYNRQAFDQKAISMTENYASVGASKMDSGGQGSQTLPKLSMEITEARDSNTSTKPVHDYALSHKRFCGVSRKLTLEPLESDQKGSDRKEVNQVPSNSLDGKQKEDAGLKEESKVIQDEVSQMHKYLQGTRKKLSLELLAPLPVKNANNVIDVEANQCSSISEPQSLVMDPSEHGFNSQQKPHPSKVDRSASSTIGTSLGKDLLKSLESGQGTGEDNGKVNSVPQLSAIQSHSSGTNQNFPLPQAIDMNERESQNNVADGHGNGFTRIKHKKLGLAGRRLNLGQLVSNQCPQQENKENLAPNSSVPYSHLQQNPSSNFNIQLQMQAKCTSKTVDLRHDSCYDWKSSPKDCDEKISQGVDNLERVSPSSDSVVLVVLDSEDSEEEKPAAARPKLSLGRRCLPAKKKS